MKICIPTNDDRGMDAVLCDHFGSAPFFTFIDTETGTCEVMKNGGSDHVHGACRPLEFMGKRPVDAVVCRGLGRGAFSKLQAGGVKVLVSLEADVSETVRAFEEDRLLAMSLERACGGHGHGHAHGHAHSHAHGHIQTPSGQRSGGR